MLRGPGLCPVAALGVCADAETVPSANERRAARAAKLTPDGLLDGMSLGKTVIWQSLLDIALSGFKTRTVNGKRSRSQHQYYHESDQQFPTHFRHRPFVTRRSPERIMFGGIGVLSASPPRTLRTRHSS